MSVGDKIMNKVLKVCGSAMLALSAASFAGADSVTLKFHTMVPMPANSNAKFVKPWADKISAESNGEIKVEMYPSMQLGGAPPQLVDQVRDGVVDIVWTVAGYTPGRFPRLEVFEPWCIFVNVFPWFIHAFIRTLVFDFAL